MTENGPGEKEGNAKQDPAKQDPAKQEGAHDGGAPCRLTELATAVGAAGSGQGTAKGRGPSPVEAWHPPYCGDIDLRIAADGTWFYAGTPITRRPLVELFAGILRKDPERYVLVTPVECVGITVEDVPFVAVAMVQLGGGQVAGGQVAGGQVTGGQVTGGQVAGGQGGTAAEAARLRFVTNVGDEVEAGPDNPLRFEAQPDGGLRPYVLVRGGLWARLTRSLAIDLLDNVVAEGRDTAARLGVRSGEAFFPVDAAASP